MGSLIGDKPRYADLQIPVPLSSTRQSTLDMALLHGGLIVENPIPCGKPQVGENQRSNQPNELVAAVTVPMCPGAQSCANPQGASVVSTSAHLTEQANTFAGHSIDQQCINLPVNQLNPHCDSSDHKGQKAQSHKGTAQQALDASGAVNCQT